MQQQQPERLVVTRLNPLAFIPQRGSARSAGLDLTSIECAIVPPGHRKLISTGLSVQLPEGTYGRIAPRSGLALRSGVHVGAGVVPQRMGNRHPSIAPYETLAAEDGHIAICCGNDGQFAKLAAALGAPGLSQDPRFTTNAGRVTNREDLVLLLESALSADTVDTWTQRLTAVGVPAGKVGSIADAIHLAERAMGNANVRSCRRGKPLRQHRVHGPGGSQARLGPTPST